MQYTQLASTYKYDVLAGALAARELEFFHYDFDRINFEKMLETLPEGPHREEVVQRLTATRDQMKNVDLIYDALMSQVDDPSELEAAIVRAKAKQAT